MEKYDADLWQILKTVFHPSTSKVDIDAFAAYYASPTYWSKVQQENQEPPLGLFYIFGGWAIIAVILPETLWVNAKVVPDRFVPTLFSQYGGELGFFHKSAEVYGLSGKFLAVFVAAKV